MSEQLGTCIRWPKYVHRKDDHGEPIPGCTDWQPVPAPAVAAPAEGKHAAIIYRDQAAIEYPRLVVCGIIIKYGRVLLERRAPSGIAGLDNSWDLPGGKVEKAETPQQAMVRELQEELGITVAVTKVLAEAVPSIWTYTDGDRHWLLVGCVCTVVEGHIIENDRLRWHPLDHLPKEILDADRVLIQLASTPPLAATVSRDLEGKLRELARKYCEECGAEQPGAHVCKIGPAIRAAAAFAHAEGRLEQFQRMKHERPLDPVFWDIKEKV